MFRIVSGMGIALLFLAVLLLSGEKAEARPVPHCWDGKTVWVQLNCHYSGYYCDCSSGYYYLKFSRTGRLADFDLFWPGGRVIQNISKDELKVIVIYPGEGFIIKIHFHFACEGNECIPLVSSGQLQLWYEGMGIITSCSMSDSYCYYGEAGLTTDKADSAELPDEAISLVGFVNNLVAEHLSHQK